MEVRSNLCCALDYVKQPKELHGAPHTYHSTVYTSAACVCLCLCMPIWQSGKSSAWLSSHCLKYAEAVRVHDYSSFCTLLALRRAAAYSGKRLDALVMDAPVWYHAPKLVLWCVLEALALTLGVWTMRECPFSFLLRTLLHVTAAFATALLKQA